jgi:hypothetical protein
VDQQENITGQLTPVGTHWSKIIQIDPNKKPIRKNPCISMVDLTRESPPFKATPLIEEATVEKIGRGQPTSVE